jgi:hypothetical protein
MDTLLGNLLCSFWSRDGSISCKAANRLRHFQHTIKGPADFSGAFFIYIELKDITGPGVLFHCLERAKIFR